MSELLPCPHHEEAVYPKRKAQHIQYHTEYGKDHWVVSYECPKCGCGYFERSVSAQDADEKAVRDWNTRYERTCRNKSVEGKRLLLCSKCGAFTKVTNATEYIDVRYCGNCGAKVDGHEDADGVE